MYFLLYSSQILHFLHCVSGTLTRRSLQRLAVLMSSVSCLCVCLKCLHLTCSLMGTVSAHCLTAAQGTIVYIAAVLFSAFCSNSRSPLLSARFPPLLLSFPAFICSTASIHNRSITLVTHCVEAKNRDS